MLTMIPLACPNCAAPLASDDESAGPVTCARCGAALAVERDAADPAAPARVRLVSLPQSAAAAGSPAELERLDAEWERQRRQLLLRTRDDRFCVPRPLAAWAKGLSLVALGALVLWVGLSTRGIVLGMLGSMFALLGLVSAAVETLAARQYARAESDYLRARQRLLSGRGG